MNSMTPLSDLAAAAAYVRGQLEFGRALSQALLQGWDFSRGRAWTTVHSSLGPHESLDFVQGGKLAAVRKQRLEEPPAVLTRFLEERLASERGALVVENQMLRKGESSTGYLPGRTATLGEFVYSFVPAEEADRSTISDVLVRTFAQYLNVMVLVASDFASGIPEDGAELSEAFFGRVAASATTLIVGAYDEEAHVVWRKQ